MEWRMMIRMKRKLLSLALALMILLSIAPIVGNAESFDRYVSRDMIPHNVAEIIALHFLNDSINDPKLSWTSETEIYSCQTMFDVDGNVSAYSFELKTNGCDTGYIVISAYPDVPSVVLEFSDKSSPIYEEFNIQPGDAIIYTGLLNYYKDDGGPSLTSIDNEQISISEIPTPLADSRNKVNLQSVQVQSKYPIDDPFSWADYYYRGPFVYSGDSVNEFENYCKFRRTSDFHGYRDHCGPTAITNLLEMIGSYKRYSKITNTNYQNIFKEVANYGIKRGYYSNPGGSSRSNLNAFIKGAFGLYSVNVNVSNKNATFNNIKMELKNHRPFYLTLRAHPGYGNHGVAGYAYTRLQSKTTGDYLSFVKIADGWANYGRYLDITSLDESHQAELRAIRIR